MRRLANGFGAGLLALLLTGVAAPFTFAGPPALNSDIAGAPRRAAGTASLTITVRTCPAAYDPTATDADPATDCREPAGDTSFALAMGSTAGPSASTGTSGDAPQHSTVSFSALSPGRYRLSVTAPAEIGGAFVWSCTSTTRALASPFAPLTWIGPDSSLTVEPRADEALACDWYQIASTAR